jgi:predicted RNase H-like nuclease
MQAWRLVPRIVEVDDLVPRHPELHEVHPEVAFALQVGDVLPRKRSWAGVTTRRAVLERHGVVLPDRFPGDVDAGPDDVLDAAVCAWVADALAGAGAVVHLPDATGQRDHGRPITITARVPAPVQPGPRLLPRSTA